MFGIDEQPHIGRWPRVALNLLAISMVSYLLASAAVELFVATPLPALHNTSLSTDTRAQKASVPPLQYFADIRKRNAFKAASPAPSRESAFRPRTNLQIAKVQAKLLGTIHSDIPTFSRAIVLDKGQQRLVKVGEKVEGYTIHAIQRRGVVLKKGNSEQLLLIDSSDKAIASGPPVIRKTISRLALKQQLKNIGVHTKGIQFTEENFRGQQRLRVNQLRPGTLFSRVGLRTGDILVSVGGYEISSQADLIHLADGLEQETLEIDVRRDEKHYKYVLLLTR